MSSPRCSGFKTNIEPGVHRARGELPGIEQRPDAPVPSGLGVNLQTVIDPEGVIAAAYGVDVGLPVNVLSDRSGTWPGS